MHVRKFWDWMPSEFRRSIWRRLPLTATDKLRSMLKVRSPERPELPTNGRWLVQPLSSEIRDTDRDWREIASREPFWGVSTEERYKTSRLDENSLSSFFAAGRQDIKEAVFRLRALGARFPVDRAIDFGCGVGRMLLPMRGYAREVYGVDVAPAMLDLATRHAKRFGVGAVTLAQEIPPGAFNWINSFTVFQHIDPRRGYPLLNELLSRTASRACVSLNFTICRNAEVNTEIEQQPLGTMQMYDYDASQILASLFSHGFENLNVRSTCHGTHVGMTVFARRVD